MPLSFEQLPSVPLSPTLASSPFNLENQRIILVENEEIIRHGFHTLLEKWGCHVVSGDSLESIEAQLQDPAQTVDAVISDFGLSEEENGIEVIEKLRVRFGKQLPAFLITGDTSQATLQAARQAGLAMLHKPVRPWLLRQTLCAQIRQPAEA